MKKKKKEALFDDLRQKREEVSFGRGGKKGRKEEALAALTESYSEMVKSVLTPLKEAMYPLATVDEEPGYWKIMVCSRIYRQGGSTRIQQDHVKVQMVLDSGYKPTHFLCTYWKPVCFFFNFHMKKKRKSGLSREDLIKTLHDLHAEHVSN